MSTTKPLIFKEIEIEDENGDNGSTYGQHLQEELEPQIESEDTQIEDGQTVTDFYSVTLNASLYDTSILDDARVRTSGADPAIRCNVILKGATGTDDLKLSSVILNGRRDFSGNRTTALISCTKRAVELDETIVPQS